MTASTYKIPANAEEAAAAEKATATYYLARIDAARDLMNGAEAQAFEKAVADLLVDPLPIGTSAAVNLPQVVKWFADVKAGLDADRLPLDRMVNPPAPVAPAPEAPAES